MGRNNFSGPYGSRRSDKSHDNVQEGGPDPWPDPERFAELQHSSTDTNDNKTLVNSNGIEITKSVELDYIRELRANSTGNDQRSASDTESGSQDEIPLRR